MVIQGLREADDVPSVSRLQRPSNCLVSFLPRGQVYTKMDGGHGQAIGQLQHMSISSRIYMGLG